MPRLSILIPCVGGAAEFDATLVSVLQHRPPDCEVLLLHTESYDDPYDLGDEVQFVRASSRSRLVELINAGVAAAAGEFVHILGCGIEVTEGWTAAPLARFDDPEIAAVSPLVLSSDSATLLAAGVRWKLGGTRRVVASQKLMQPGAARLRSCILGPTLAAGFYRLDVLQALGGFDVGLDERYADVDFALALQALELRSICEPASRVIQTIERELPCRAPLARGRSAERLFWQNAARLGQWPSGLLHPFALLGDMAATRSGLGTIASFLGRSLALLEFGSLRRHEERLTLARERLAESCDEQATIPLPAPSHTATVSDKSRRRAA